jgi:hypothetical protein
MRRRIYKGAEYVARYGTRMALYLMTGPPAYSWCHRREEALRIRGEDFEAVTQAVLDLIRAAGYEPKKFHPVKAPRAEPRADQPTLF